ncbi:MAG: S8 family serine peptidase [Pseudomonadota bacterium]
MWRKALLLSAANVAICTHAAAQSDQHDQGTITPRGGDIAAFGGDISAFGGDIAAFGGDISAFAGDISAFSGDIAAFGGDIAAFHGDIAAFSGDISAFHGEINPFRGDVSPFYGDISPFWGDISAFWGDINPYGGDIAAFNGDIAAFGGDISAFWGDIAPFGPDGDQVLGGLGTYWAIAGPIWGDINDAWDAAINMPGDNTAALDALADQIDDFVGLSANAWRDTVRDQTGLWFRQGFSNPLLSDFGVDLTDSGSLDNVSAVERSALFLAWYDGLMAYAGTDQVDHWMPQVNWTPAITQDQGEGHDARVGLLDARIADTEHSIEYLVDVGGYDTVGSHHGAAVASIIAARHDGQGTMGLAPRATVYHYNPFDETGTAGHDDISAGIHQLAAYNANVINMSLGVPGHTFDQGIADILSDQSLSIHSNDTVIVAAAGNEGATQTEDVQWNDDGIQLSSLLIVGSVNPVGGISHFSNRPGVACFTSQGICEDGNRLMDRFLVAPGELILVSDNNGGTTRASGTSFAAPIVTGAISLLHDRWPWLQEHADVTTEIILETAQDLGEPGVDEVYGHGLLDVEASQSPLDWNNLEVWLNVGGNSTSMTSVQLATAAVDQGTLNLWEAQGANIYAFETIGDTHRDFYVPLSSLLDGQTMTVNNNTERFQRHTEQRLLDWANAQQQSIAPATNGLTGLNNGFVPVNGGATWTLSFTPGDNINDWGALHFEANNGSLSVVSGQGGGVQHFTAMDGFDQLDDYNPKFSGANPMLGLATGGAFNRVSFAMPKSMRLSLGRTTTSNDQRIQDVFTGEFLVEDSVFGSRDASATFAELAFNTTERLSIGVGYTHLREEDGILGSQGAGVLTMDGGSRTDSVTMSANYRLTERLSLAGSMTGSTTRGTALANSPLTVGDDGVQASAFQVNANYRQLFNKTDRLTLSVAQPLHIEAGSLSYTSVQVVDRETGELGEVTEEWSLVSGGRHLAYEAEYAMSFNEGRMSVGAFTRYDQNDVDIEGTYSAYSIGTRFAVKY